MNQKQMYYQSLKRPSNYADLSSQEQWAIDKELSILDYDGTVPDNLGCEKFVCESCNGTGLVTTDFVDDFSSCHTCLGRGSFTY